MENVQNSAIYLEEELTRKILEAVFAVVHKGLKPQMNTDKH
jgi:hypothetical protein